MFGRRVFRVELDERMKANVARLVYVDAECAQDAAAPLEVARVFGQRFFVGLVAHGRGMNHGR